MNECGMNEQSLLSLRWAYLDTESMTDMGHIFIKTVALKFYTHYFYYLFLKILFLNLLP